VRWFWIVLTGYALLVLEVSVVPVFRQMGGGPDLMLLFVIFLSLYGHVDDAPIVGWFLGLAKDSLSTGPFGLYAVLFLAAAFILSRIRSDIYLESGKAHAANAGVATLFVYLANCFWRWSEGGDLGAMVPVAIGVAIWNAAVAPLAFGIFLRYGRRMGASRRLGDV